MPTTGKSRQQRQINRRRLLQVIGVGTAAGLAGCAGGDDGNDGTTADNGGGDLGERVPTLSFQFWSDQGNPTVAFEEMISQIQSNSDAIGIQVEPIPMTTGQGISEVSDDTRQFHFAVNSHGPDPGRLDPNNLMTAYSISYAGANGLYNPANYASCEFTELADAQRTIGNPEDRQRAVDDAMEVYSNDVPFITALERPTVAAVNTDQLTEIESGGAGLPDIHWASVLESQLSARSGTDSVVSNLAGEFLTSSFYPTVSDTDGLSIYTILTNSPLLMYDSDFELQPNLATNWEAADDGLTTTFELADATFHNGEPVTPEDIKWTYEFLSEQYHAGNYPWTALPEDLTVEVIDDSTVAFKTGDPHPTLTTASLPIYGVIPRDPYVEAGIEDNPTNFEDPMIGAGPYQLTTYNNQQNALFEPHDGHPLYSPTTDIFTQIYDSTDAVVRAMQGGEINLAVGLTPEAGQQLEERMGDSVQVIYGQVHLPFGMMPQMSYAPGMHREFRLAVSNLIDRRAVNETYAFGESKPLTQCTFMSTTHPFHNPDVLTEIADETANPDRARSLLEEAGWGWDDDGNLHYPPGAEQEAWPQGETPDPDEFPCVS